jgi:hypothetical protein
MAQFSGSCHTCGTAGLGPFIPEICVACGAPDPAGPSPLAGAPRACRVCGCTHDDACWHDQLGPCSWVEADLCSHCQMIAAGAIAREDVEQPADRAAFQAD